MNKVEIEKLAPKLGEDERVLRQDELESVNGGYGCIYTGGAIPIGPNPWLEWGSPERGGAVWQPPT